MVDVTFLIGTLFISIVSLILSFSLLKRYMKTKSIPILLLLIALFYDVVGGSFRVIYLLGGDLILNHLWIAASILTVISFLFISIIFLKPKYEKLLLKIYLFLLFLSIFSFFVPEVVLNIININFNIILTLITFLIFVYIYIKNRIKKILFFIISLFLFIIAGALARFYLPLFYILSPIGLIIMTISFHIK